MIALDSGALIAFERGVRRVVRLVGEAQEDGIDLLVSTVVLAEVWRDPPSPLLARLLNGCVVRPVDDATARAAGRAIGRTGASTIDALIAAGAARAGAPLLTSDPDDMRALAEHFAGLRLIAV